MKPNSHVWRDDMNVEKVFQTHFMRIAAIEMIDTTLFA